MSRGPGNRSRSRSRGRSVGLRLIILMVAVGGIILSGLSVGWLAERDARSALERELEGRLLAEARALARVGSDALLADFPELALLPLVTDLREQRPELQRVVVTDHEGRIQGSEDAREIGTPFDGSTGTTTADAVGGQVHRDGDAILVSCPVLSSTGETIGRVHLSASSAYVSTILQEARVRGLLTTLVLVGAGALVTYLIIARFLRPLGEIQDGLHRIGHGDLDNPIEVDDRTELGLLAETVNEMVEELKEAQGELVEKERLRHEMGLARELQHSLLSLGERRFGEFQVLTSYHPAMEVGGDYCDVFAVDEDRLAVVIADVSGKGLSGCLVTAMLSVGLRALPLATSTPREALLELERRLAPSLRPGTFVTVFLGLLDRRDNRFRFSSAAHNPLLLIHADGSSRWHYARGIPLGAVGGGALAATLVDDEIVLEPGDLIVQTTDGINEARRATDGEQLGFQRLAAAASEGAELGAPGVVEVLKQKLEAWRGVGGEIDDETLLVLEHVPTTRPHESSGAHPVTMARPGSPVDALYRLMSDRDHLQMRARLEDLALLSPWLESCADLRGLDPIQMTLLRHGLYEACANIMEHCYEMDAGRKFDLWRLPSAIRSPAQGQDSQGPGAVLRRVQSGYFMLRDDGRTFDAGAWRPTDFEDREARLRGRGIGLDVIHASMRTVTYLPDTPVGNVTLLRYDPQKHVTEERTNDRELRDPIAR